MGIALDHRDCEQARVTRLVGGDTTMANQDQHEDVRRRQPNATAPDPRETAVQRQIHADTEVNRQQGERLKATPAPEISGETVEEIAEEAEQRAKR
jgi:hypothetical protein